MFYPYNIAIKTKRGGQAIHYDDEEGPSGRDGMVHQPVSCDTTDEPGHDESHPTTPLDEQQNDEGNVGSNNEGGDEWRPVARWRRGGEVRLEMMTMRGWCRSGRSEWSRVEWSGVVVCGVGGGSPEVSGKTRKSSGMSFYIKLL
nr:hypothetical protein [Tanacetum cinerariifolium]